MATFAPANLARGAARRPLPFGLFSVVNFETPFDPHWQAGGVVWDFFYPNTIDSVGHTDNVTGAPSTGTPKVFNVASPLPVGTAIPFSVYGHDKMSAVRMSQEEAEFRALQHLAAFEEHQVSQHLWFGDMNNRPFINEAPTSLGAATSAGVAVGLLEDFIEETYGSLGVMHLSRSMATQLVDVHLLEVRGTQLQTRLGTPVSVSEAYPDGTIRATPALFGLRSEVFYSSQPGSPLIDVKTNDLYAIAERTYLLGYDPTGVGSVTVS